MAKLYFRYGAMNSGKSTALMQVAYNYEERGMNILLIKPGVDSKGEDFVVSRLGVKRKVDYLVSEDVDLYQTLMLHLKKEPIHCVLVDEAQFLKKKQIDELLHIVLRLHVPVICYGLRIDFQMEGFEGALRLMTLAHSVEEIKTICRCGKKAMFNGRKINGNFVFEGDQVAIDGENEITYEALCGSCYLDKREK